MNARQAIEQYKEIYLGMYGDFRKSVPEVCIMDFCRINGITWPLESVEELEPPDETFWRTMEPGGKETDG